MPNMKIPLFHCNLAPVVAELLALRSVVSNHPMDIYWEGDGMYFWDNFGNARYWQMQKASPTQIVECSVEFDYEKDLLDLTDLEQERVLKRASERVKYIKYGKIGAKIDYFCLCEGLKIVRCFGVYEKTPQTGLFKGKRVHLSNKVKVIYCLKARHDELLKEAFIRKDEVSWVKRYLNA